MNVGSQLAHVMTIDTPSNYIQSKCVDILSAKKKHTRVTEQYIYEGNEDQSSKLGR